MNSTRPRGGQGGVARVVYGSTFANGSYQCATPIAGKLAERSAQLRP
jgi:hypothetical protein